MPNTPNIFTTPMMQQYMKIKEDYKDCIVLFRLGDFYEMFLDDAKLGAEILDITLTSRSRGRDGRIPMSGIPYHALESYLSKLIKAGHKVAICEQIGDTKEPGLVERQVVRVVTPGTVLESVSLERKENNFILAIHKEESVFGVALADLSTGAFVCAEYPSVNFENVITNEIAKFSPSECVLSDEIYNDGKILKSLKIHKNLNIYPFAEWHTYASRAKDVLKEHFGIHSLSSFEIEELQTAQKASSALLGYLKFTQKRDLYHIKKISVILDEDAVSIDRSTMFNLEFFSTIKEGSKKGSLISILDKTSTAMGGRLLRRKLVRPLKDRESLEEIYDGIDFLITNKTYRDETVTGLENIRDIDRLLSRLSVGIGNPKDVINLRDSLVWAAEIGGNARNRENPYVTKIGKGISSRITTIAKIISDTIVEEPPLDPKNGNFVRTGVSRELDDLKFKILSSKDYVINLEQREKERTGINSLKVKFNQVFGYYIEISKSNLHLVPEDYVRKQTLVNAERFITAELKEHEDIILTAEDRIKEIEYGIFLKTVEEIMEYTSDILMTSEAIAELDCLVCFSRLAQEMDLTRPQLCDDGVISIKDGRHPSVEMSLDVGEFISNDVYLNNGDHQLLIVTGPNMAGKSVFIRQVAVIVLMAQIGSFVPAGEAKITPVDKIFVRSGASDSISSGLSTFMVEMLETASILNAATDRSLIVMDEIGRGTSTYDGISIAWSVAEYLISGANGPKTLFATHYHELQELENRHPDRIKNYHVAVSEIEHEPVFLHKVKRGGSEHSFGIQVARIAGVPQEVCEKAALKLSELREKFTEDVPKLAVAEPILVQTDISVLLAEKLKEIDLSRTTPLEALNILAEIKQIWDREWNV